MGISAKRPFSLIPVVVRVAAGVTLKTEFEQEETEGTEI
jgi:hypothetical protein